MRMFINSLKFPYNKKPNPNLEEDIDRLLFREVEQNIDCALEKAYQADLIGDNICADKNYTSVAYYYVLIEFIQIIRRYTDEIGIVNKACTPTDVYEHFKLDCVLRNLQCTGKRLEQNYTKFFKEGLAIAGVGFDPSACNDCCTGLGEMILEDPSGDCLAFIIGPCVDSNEIIVEPSTGEFTTNEFYNNERT